MLTTEQIQFRTWNKGSVLRRAFLSLALFLVTACVLTEKHANAEPAPGQSSGTSGVSGQNYEGMITDTRCGAKHSAEIGLAASNCTRVCVHAGEHFVLVDGDNLYLLEGDSQALKHLAGERVRIVGILNGNKLFVSSVASDN